jgi:translation initiation factor IF-1
MSFGATHTKPKNKKKGRIVIQDTLIDVEKGEGFYGKVIKLLGLNRVMILLNTGSEVQATFPGKFRKKLWIHINNIVLVNESYEILDLIKDSHKRFVEATTMLRKITSLDDYFIREKTDTSEALSDIFSKNEIDVLDI